MMDAVHLETWEGDHYSASIYNLPNSNDKTIWMKVGIAAIELEAENLREFIELMEYVETRIKELNDAGQ